MKIYNNIILASTSERRIEILGGTGIAFNIEASSYEEDMTLNMNAVDLVEYLALGKADEVSNKFPNDLVIGADTFVVYENKKLGKPKSEKEAVEMLQMFSGQTIQVITGVALLHKDSDFKEIFHETSVLKMREISDEFIEAYVATNIPYSRAGGFGIQDIGARIIESIDGDYFNALGLPLYTLLTKLYKINPDIMVDSLLKTE